VVVASLFFQTTGSRLQQRKEKKISSCGGRSWRCGTGTYGNAVDDGRGCRPLRITNQISPVAATLERRRGAAGSAAGCGAGWDVSVRAKRRPAVVVPAVRPPGPGGHAPVAGIASPAAAAAPPLVGGAVVYRADDGANNGSGAASSWFFLSIPWDYFFYASNECVVTGRVWGGGRCWASFNRNERKRSKHAALRECGRRDAQKT
jgi:hypothetical protein